MVTQDYIVSWGIQGFGNPAFGIQTNIADKRFELGSATANTAYDFYIRTNCNSSVSNSGWAGPFTYTTLPCADATAITTTNISQTGAQANWTSNNAYWNLEYGAAGFTLGSGTSVNGLNSASYTFANLTANTAYDFYLQDSCSAGLNPWKGPYSFTTAQTTGIGAATGSLAFSLYPNPAHNKVMVHLDGDNEAATIVIRDNLGVIVYQSVSRNKNTEINTAGLLPGVYFITISKGNASGNRKIVVQH